MSEPKGGRPKASEPGSAVTVWLRQSDHDRLIQLAKRADTSVSSVASQLIKKGFPTK